MSRQRTCFANSASGDSGLTSTAELVRARAADHHVGLLFEDAQYRWSEIVQESADRAAAALALQRPGPFHIGVLLDNQPEHLFWLFAAALSGATTVEINPTRRGAELARDVMHTDCQLIVTDKAGRAVLNDLQLDLADDRVICIDEVPYADLLTGHGNTKLDDLPDTPPTTPLMLLFTSGSTGAPKAVICSQGRYAGIVQHTSKVYGLGQNDVCYNAMPMFHANALMACLAPAIGTGCTWALRRTFSASGFLPDVRKFGATYFNYVGRTLAYVLATPERSDDGENTLRLGFGSEASSRDLVEFTRRFGCEFAEGYGSSEGQIGINRTADAPATALGRPRPDATLIIVNPDTDAECPPARFGTHGELLNLEAIGELVRVDGSRQFEGYYNNPQATAERTRGGHYWSGDLGYRDEAGWIYFAGRNADWLRVDGENFSAAPVERIISAFPGVLVNAVYAVPDTRTGDQVMVAIEMESGRAFDAAAFDQFLDLQNDLGAKWAPRYVRIVERMPLTGTNKIDKNPLRAVRWEITDGVWWRPARGESLQLITDDDIGALRAEFDLNGRRHVIG